MKNNFATMPLRFRAWDEEEKRWLISYKLIDFARGTLCVWGDELCFEERNVKVSQDTGLKDKNGKSIYTGDILKWTRHFVKRADCDILGVVQYLAGNILMSTFSPEGFKKNHIPICGITPDLEIAGNIWENPELLEG